LYAEPAGGDSEILKDQEDKTHEKKSEKDWSRRTPELPKARNAGGDEERCEMFEKELLRILAFKKRILCTGAGN